MEVLKDIVENIAEDVINLQSHFGVGFCLFIFFPKAYPTMTACRTGLVFGMTQYIFMSEQNKTVSQRNDKKVQYL